jgi:hypothetical protein
MAEIYEDKPLKDTTNVSTWEMEELEEEFDRLKTEKMHIEQQLANRNKTDNFGMRISNIDFQKWRSKAVFAKTAIDKNMIVIKQEMRARRSSDMVKYIEEDHTCALLERVKDRTRCLENVYMAALKYVKDQTPGNLNSLEKVLNETILR